VLNVLLYCKFDKKVVDTTEVLGPPELLPVLHNVSHLLHFVILRNFWLGWNEHTPALYSEHYLQKGIWHMHWPSLLDDSSVLDLLHEVVKSYFPTKLHH
jgi:hypothetical protein